MRGCGKTACDQNERAPTGDDPDRRPLVEDVQLVRRSLREKVGEERDAVAPTQAGAGGTSMGGTRGLGHFPDYPGCHAALVLYDRRFERVQKLTTQFPGEAHEQGLINKIPVRSVWQSVTTP